MKRRTILIIIGFILVIIASYVLYQNTIGNEPVAYKPNIYLYPEENKELEVRLNFSKGGKVIESIPKYGEGWSVRVNKTGKIDSKYDYLFYESEQPNHWQYDTGWEIEKKELKKGTMHI